MKSALALSALMAGLLVSANALAADASVAATTTATRASGAVKGVKVTGATGATTGKVNAQVGGTITSKGDESQYPTGTPVVPPKPKKDGPEAGAAIKANVKAAQP